MTDKEFREFLSKNKKEVEKASREFDKHSDSFDEKFKRILSLL